MPTVTTSKRPLDASRLGYSPEEAATISGVSRAFLYLEMQRGKLDSIKVGRRRLIRRSDLLAWLGETERA